MGNLYLRLISCAIVLSIFVLRADYAHARQSRVLIDSASRSHTKANTKITDTRSDKPTFLKNGVKVSFTPFKPSQAKIASSPSASSNTVVKKDDENEKVLNNVRVYPNPVGVSEKLNLSYNVDKDSNVTIKIMDLLGNEVVTLLNQRVSAGSQTNSFFLSDLSSRLNSGFYFIRFIVGTETVIKRISVL